MAIQRQLHPKKSGKKNGMSRNNRVTLAACNECHYFYHKQDKKCRWRTTVKKTNICIVKAIASGSVVSSTIQERHYKQQR